MSLLECINPRGICTGSLRKCAPPCWESDSVSVHHVSWKQPGSRKSQLTKPLPFPHPLPSLPPFFLCHRWQWTKLTAHCCVPRLTIGFRLSLRGNCHVGFLPFVWDHWGVLPLHHAAPTQWALGSLWKGRGGQWGGVMVMVAVVEMWACRTQHRLTKVPEKNRGRGYMCFSPAVFGFFFLLLYLIISDKSFICICMYWISWNVCPSHCHCLLLLSVFCLTAFLLFWLSQTSAGSVRAEHGTIALFHRYCGESNFNTEYRCGTKNSLSFIFI